MKYAAVIVETRKVDGFGQIVKSHMKHLPADWDLVVWTGQFNKDYVETQVPQATKLLTCNVDNIDKYNKLLLSVGFWTILNEYDRVLIFQSDSMLLKDGIELFLKYSYVGAPWIWANDRQKGGNGGLSIREPMAMIKAILNHKPQGENEDIFFSNHCENVSPREVSEMFSCETIFKLGTQGYHAIEKWLTPEQCEQIKTQYN